MKIAFFGDVHGCVLHALGGAVLLARHRGFRPDALVQVGDLGAYPGPDRWDEASVRWGAENPVQHDLFRLLDPSPELAAGVRRVLDEVPGFLFVSGNHEDHPWLDGLHRAAGGEVTPIDPLAAFRHVDCGTVIDVAGQRTAFLGRIEKPGYMDLDPDAYERLLAAEPGSVDILVTHDGPYGMSSDSKGEVQGSRKLSALIEHLQPRLHVGGHYHHENGPRRYGRTTSHSLAQLVPPKAERKGKRANPRVQIAPGSIGVLDTESYEFEYVHDAWLADVHGENLDLTALLNGAP